MIPRSRRVVVIAVALAIAAHSLTLVGFSSDETVEIEGGGAAKAAALGSTFKDFTAGSSAASVAKTRQMSTTPDQLQPKASHSLQSQVTTPPKLSQVPSEYGVAPQRTIAPNPAKPEKTETPKPQVDVASSPTVNDAKRPEPQEQKGTQVASPKGNAKQSRRKGDATGKTPEGSATAKTSAHAAAEPGNATSSNYAGLIKRKIIRARRKSANIRGAALVAFRIADNGALQTVSIARSSGSKRLDQIALAQVKAAAPFPPPPAGVRRDYSFEIKGQR